MDIYRNTNNNELYIVFFTAQDYSVYAPDNSKVYFYKRITQSLAEDYNERDKYFVKDIESFDLIYEKVNYFSHNDLVEQITKKLQVVSYSELTEMYTKITGKNISSNFNYEGIKYHIVE
jgi:hypothetical protein